MNSIAEEIMSYYGSSENEESLEHYGVKRRSGRYPWGSGEDPYQHGEDFLSRVEAMRKDNFTYVDDNGKVWTGDTAIAKSLGLTSTQFRTEIGIATDERRMLQVETAKRLRDKEGLGATDIGKKMGVNESTVRSWLNADSEARMNQAKETAKFIKEQVDKKGFIDVGSDVNRELNVSPEKLNQALYLLEREGYNVYSGRIPQATNPGQMTTVKAICPPGTEYKELYSAFKNGEVRSLNEYISRDGGNTYEKKFHYPESMDSKRLKVRYAEEGGIEKDGIIELRRGVDDLSLGESRYSQVRILVDGTHYLKGMAVYSDDMPPGIDVIFNTNKKKGTPALGPKDNTVLKQIKKDDPDNPFGSAIKDAEQGGQYWYTDKNGNKKLGLINKRADEGDWSDWKDALPAQFLSKQPLQMAQKQLKIALTDKAEEYNEICSLTNPTIKKHLLSKFADECDSAAVHLKAAALPGQKYHVLIPITSMKENEVYAPNYEDGSKVALIRYPHGGTFEIPILTVNNKQPMARKLLGTDVRDAVGINSKVAERLSGADFDGDTAMVIPTHDRGGRVKLASTPPLKGLEGFDPKTEYGPETYKGRTVKLMTKRGTQTQMGVISNLITDMTLKGAGPEDLAKAVRHSMVVIDAEKHRLDYKKSEIDNDIATLKKKYQTYVDADGKVHSGGASTLLSRSKGEQAVPKRQGSPIINMKGSESYDPSKPEGSLIWKQADDAEYQDTRVNKRTGEVTTITKTRTQKSTRMAETNDASTLISDANTPMERAYAEYANAMKSMANQARKEMMSTGKIAYSKEAKAKYQNEVDSLNSKLNIAELNRPRERQAQMKAYAEIEAKKKAYKEANGKEMSASDAKKISQQAISKYREEVGSVARRDRNIKISDREWEAIQAGAITETQLKKILNNADVDSLRERATPRTTTALSQAKANRIKAMSASYTIAQIAEKLGISTSTVSKYLKE